MRSNLIKEIENGHITALENLHLCKSFVDNALCYMFYELPGFKLDMWIMKDGTLDILDNGLNPKIFAVFCLNLDIKF